MIDKSTSAILVLAVTLSGGHALGDDAACPGQKLVASDAANLDLFGESVAVSGDMALVGASFDDDDGDGSGSVYVFRRTGPQWDQVQKLTASDGAAVGRFGRSVALSDELAVVGATGADGNEPGSGAAYVFRWDGAQWGQEQKLTAPDGATADNFGGSVAVSDDVAVIGASRDDDNGFRAGSVYVFRWDGAQWIQEQKLLASDGAADDFFGSSVSISGHVIAVESALVGQASRAAYMFRWNGAQWVEEQKLALSSWPPNCFGGPVSVSGDVAVVGALCDVNNGAATGSAYVYRWDGAQWIQEQKLYATDGAEGHFFGNSVCVSGDVAVIGAFYDDDNGGESGSAYVFRWYGAEWIEERKLLAFDGTWGDRFGWSVSVSGDVVLVGATWDDNTCVWDLDYDTVVNVTDLLLLIGSFGSCDGCPADFDGDGSVDVVDLLALIASFGPCPDSAFGECPWDVDQDGVVDSADIQAVTQHFGPCDDCCDDYPDDECCYDCQWDVDGNWVVDSADVQAITQHLGPCPAIVYDVGSAHVFDLSCAPDDG